MAVLYRDVGAANNVRLSNWINVQIYTMGAHIHRVEAGKYLTFVNLDKSLYLFMLHLLWNVVLFSKLFSLQT